MTKNPSGSAGKSHDKTTSRSKESGPNKGRATSPPAKGRLRARRGATLLVPAGAKRAVAACWRKAGARSSGRASRSGSSLVDGASKYGKQHAGTKGPASPRWLVSLGGAGGPSLRTAIPLAAGGEPNRKKEQTSFAPPRGALLRTSCKDFPGGIVSGLGWVGRPGNPFSSGDFYAGTNAVADRLALPTGQRIKVRITCAHKRTKLSGERREAASAAIRGSSRPPRRFRASRFVSWDSLLLSEGGNGFASPTRPGKLDLGEDFKSSSGGRGDVPQGSPGRNVHQNISGNAGRPGKQA